jgi:PKHD-type hydroxylase
MLEFPQWIMFESELTEEECDFILHHGKSLVPVGATTFGDHMDDTRKTQVRWINDDGVRTDGGIIHDRIRQICYQANQHFKLKLTYLPPLQFTEYIEPGHHYAHHHDVEFNDQRDRHRKLSIIVQLSDPADYDGAEFSFKFGEQPPKEAMMKRGTVLTFISYHEHMVSEIITGERRSLVGWFEGTRWA